jgi:hypothetical protein
LRSSILLHAAYPKSSITSANCSTKKYHKKSSILLHAAYPKSWPTAPHSQKSVP